MKTVVCLTLIGVLSVAALTGCGELRTDTSPVDGDSAAQQMLALAPRLPGAKETSAFPEHVFAGPAQQPACQPLTIRTAFWSSTMSGPAATSYLSTHVGSHFQLEASGSGSEANGATSWSVVLEPDHDSVTLPSGHRADDILAYSIARRSGGIGVRMDAVVVPDNAECARN